MSNICKCSHDMNTHDEQDTICFVVNCGCTGYNPQEEVHKRYKIGPAGNAYVVIDTTLDSTICYCSKREYADSIVSAMNYAVLCDKARQNLVGISVEGNT